MSLIIARATNKSILLVSDTKLSYSEHSYNFKKLNPYLEGTAKALLIDRCRLVAFAGTVEYARQGIDRILESDSDSDIISKLLEITSDKSDVEFIFATINPKPQVVKISNKNVTKDPVEWIGDYDGFKKYQEYFTSFSDHQSTHDQTVTFKVLQLPDEENHCDAEMYSRMFDCMSAVINSNTIDSVGGFTVPIYTQKDKLQFGTYCSIFRRPLEISELEMTDGVVPFGDVSMGTFSVNFTSLDEKSFAVHIEQGQLGFVFDSTKIQILEPELHPEMDEIDFLLILKQRFHEINLIKIGHDSLNYFKKSEPYFQKYLFLEAERFITEGIRVSSKNWKSKIQDTELQFDSITECINKIGIPLDIPTEDVHNLAIALQRRGVCRYYLGNFNGSLQDFQESLTLNPDDQNVLAWKFQAEQGQTNGALRCAITHPTILNDKSE
jgi:tetratricopeptide (TPR) repeat protein